MFDIKARQWLDLNLYLFQLSHNHCPLLQKCLLWCFKRPKIKKKDRLNSVWPLKAPQPKFSLKWRITIDEWRPFGMTKESFRNGLAKGFLPQVHTSNGTMRDYYWASSSFTFVVVTLMQFASCYDYFVSYACLRLRSCFTNELMSDALLAIHHTYLKVVGLNHRVPKYM